MNSVARIANPAGITTIAGPGKMTIATPSNKMVPPTSAIRKRFTAPPAGF
jgi:hypothetical protein